MTARAKPIGSPHCFSLPGESWKPLPLNPGYYASTLGRIASGRLRTSLGKVLVQHPTSHGRMRVSVSNGDRPIKREVHRLVCEAFHGLPPSPDLEAAHRDGDPLNNRPSNLRWATHLENIRDKALHGTQLRGSQVPTSKLTESQVLDIRARVVAGESRHKVAADHNIHRNYLDQIVRGERWSHLS